MVKYHRFREAKFLSAQLLLFTHTSIQTYALGAQKNCLIEMVLLRTYNIRFD